MREIELERGVDGEVGLAHFRAVRLPVHQDLLAEIGERELAGVARGVLKKCVILLQGGCLQRAIGGFDGGHGRRKISKLFGRVL